MNRLFIKEILSLTGAYCGEQYLAQIDALRRERERILNNYWREEAFPEKIDTGQKENLYRDIDFDTAIHHARKYLDESRYLHLLYALAEVAITYGELCRAETLLRQVTTQYLPWADPDTLALAHFKLGNITFMQNNYVSAEEEFQKSLQFMQKQENPQTVAMITNARGVLKVNANLIDEGMRLFEEAIHLSEKAKAEETFANAHMNLGNAFHMRGEWDAAMKHYQQALQVFSKYNHKENLAYIHLNLGIAYKVMNDLNKATVYLKTSMDLARETNNKYQKGLGYLLEAEIHHLQNDPASAIAFVTSAFTIFSEIGDRLSVAEAYKIFGMINRQNKEYQVAQSFFENSRRINEELGNYPNLAETLIETGKLYEQLDEKMQALNAYRSAIEYLQKIGAKAKIQNVDKLLQNLA